MPRPLGENQRYLLRSMATRHDGRWHPGCGWYWANTSTTVRMLDSLVKRGLLAKYDDKPGYPNGVWEITDAGQAEAKRSA